MEPSKQAMDGDMLEHKIEEILEFIWTLRERGSSSVKELMSIEEIERVQADEQTLKTMESMGLVRVDGDSITLTERGEEEAREAIRRHRLAEILLSEVLEIDEGGIERNACTFEHSLTPAVTESICTLLGHPPVCPHGLPIPRGRCCVRKTGNIQPLVRPLNELEIGEKGRIIFILSRSHARLDRISSLGMVPGSTVKLHQKKPAFVVEIGETTLALDEGIVREIYVKKVP